VLRDDPKGKIARQRRRADAQHGKVSMGGTQDVALHTVRGARSQCRRATHMPSAQTSRRALLLVNARAYAASNKYNIVGFGAPPKISSKRAMRFLVSVFRTGKITCTWYTWLLKQPDEKLKAFNPRKFRGYKVQTEQRHPATLLTWRPLQHPKQATA